MICMKYQIYSNKTDRNNITRELIGKQVGVSCRESQVQVPAMAFFKKKKKKNVTVLKTCLNHPSHFLCLCLGLHRPEHSDR